MRRSTRKLSVDLTPTAGFDPRLPWWSEHVQPGPDGAVPSFDNPNPDTRAIDTLKVEHYHHICYFHLRQIRHFSVSPRAELNLGAVKYCPAGSQLDDLVEIGSLTSVDAGFSGWYTTNRAAVKEIMQDGWTRYVFHLCPKGDLTNHIEGATPARYSIPLFTLGYTLLLGPGHGCLRPTTFSVGARLCQTTKTTVRPRIFIRLFHIFPELREQYLSMRFTFGLKYLP